MTQRKIKTMTPQVTRVIVMMMVMVIIKVMIEKRNLRSRRMQEMLEAGC